MILERQLPPFRGWRSARRPQREEFPGGAQVMVLVDDERHPLGAQRRGRVPQMTMQMRRGRVAGVAEPANHPAGRHLVAEMLDFLVDTKRLSRDDAYLLVSVAMNLMVTQVVDGTKGIHAMIPKAIFKR